MTVIPTLNVDYKIFTQSILSQDSLEQILLDSYKLLVCIAQFFNSWAGPLVNRKGEAVKTGESLQLIHFLCEN